MLSTSQEDKKSGFVVFLLKASSMAVHLELLAWPTSMNNEFFASSFDARASTLGNLAFYYLTTV